MRCPLAVVVALSLSASAAVADTPRPRREDAQRLLKDAIRSGTVEADAFAAISDWILYEKEEAVAAGLADVLASALDQPGVARSLEAQRWDPVAQAMLSVFARVLSDAAHNRHGDQVIDQEVAALVGIAAPMVAQALRESPVADHAKMLAVFGSLGPVADDLVPLLAKGLAHAQRDVRVGSATALAALGRAAGAAVPALKSAAEDADPAVQAAARDALKAIEAR